MEKTKKNEELSASMTQGNAPPVHQLKHDDATKMQMKANTFVCDYDYDYDPYIERLSKIVDATKIKCPASIQYKYKMLKITSREAQWDLGR